MRALGIDVGVRKGLDLVLLDEDRALRETRRHVELGDLGGWIERSKADVVAIDSPPTWALGGRSRQSERDIQRFGIQSYRTPIKDRGSRHSFYEWMRVGFKAFDIAGAKGCPRYRAGPVRGTAIEVFPHATAVALKGNLPPPGTRAPARKRRWRQAVLRAEGVDTAGLGSVDQVDAVLAALTGLYALEGRFWAAGDPEEGVIVLPGDRPGAPYPRETPAPQDGGRALPGLATCACGCGGFARERFLPGHDAKLKSRLWRQVRDGQEALDALQRMGWQAPPEVGRWTHSLSQRRYAVSR